MKFGELIPFRKRETCLTKDSPFASLQSDFHRLFEEFFRGFPVDLFDRSFGELLPARSFEPRLNVHEDASTVTVSAELPGIDEKDLDITVSDGLLTIKGEKKEESEKKQNGFFHSERVYGSFQRSLQLPAEVHSEKAEATYKKGVLTIVFPKTEKAREARKKIAVKSE